MNNAVASLNDAMPGLINRGFEWGFQKNTAEKCLRCAQV